MYKRLTTIPVDFGYFGKWHLYEWYYYTRNIAVLISEKGAAGKLSINLYSIFPDARNIGANEFYVRWYGPGLFLNDPCLETGLFEVVGHRFMFESLTYQLWRLKTLV